MRVYRFPVRFELRFFAFLLHLVPTQVLTNSLSPSSTASKRPGNSRRRPCAFERLCRRRRVHPFRRSLNLGVYPLSRSYQRLRASSSSTCADEASRYERHSHDHGSVSRHSSRSRILLAVADFFSCLYFNSRSPFHLSSRRRRGLRRSSSCQSSTSYRDASSLEFVPSQFLLVHRPFLPSFHSQHPSRILNLSRSRWRRRHGRSPSHLVDHRRTSSFSFEPRSTSSSDARHSRSKKRRERYRGGSRRSTYR